MEPQPVILIGVGEPLASKRLKQLVKVEALQLFCIRVQNILKTQPWPAYPEDDFSDIPGIPKHIVITTFCGINYGYLTKGRDDAFEVWNAEGEDLRDLSSNEYQLLVDARFIEYGSLKDQIYLFSLEEFMSFDFGFIETITQKRRFEIYLQQFPQNNENLRKVIPLLDPNTMYGWCLGSFVDTFDPIMMLFQRSKNDNCNLVHALVNKDGELSENTALSGGFLNYRASYRLEKLGIFYERNPRGFQEYFLIKGSDLQTLVF